MVKTVFDSRMTAHIWAQGTQPYGQNSNRQFYFDASILYSYGTHYAVGIRLSDITLLNSDRNSLTTEKHKSYARQAVNGDHAYIPELTGIVSDVSYLSNNPNTPKDNYKRVNIARYLQKNILRLFSVNFGTGKIGLYDEREFRAALILFNMAGLGKTEKQLLAYRAKIHAAAIKAENAKIKSATKAAYEKALQFYKDLDVHKNRALNGYDPKRAHYVSRKGAESNWPNRTLEHEYLKEQIKFFDAAICGLCNKHAAKAAKIKLAIKELRAAQKVAKAKVLKTVALADFAGLVEEFKTQYQADIWNINLWQVTAQRLLEHKRLANRPLVLVKIQSAIDKALKERDELQAELEKARFEKQAKDRADWLSGGNNRVHFSDENGGAMLRIVGDRLETSHGAHVPLADAVKVFRMVKLVKARGQGWTRNGATLPVGYFQVDAIKPSGDFIAGCHKINWPEIERVAKLHGLFDVDASDTTNHV